MSEIEPRKKVNVEHGEFPFPLTDGPRESRFLTWLRNHSNYMAARGLLDYLRTIGVLVRGIVVNFLIFLPLLLIIAIGLGYSHHWMLDHPYRLTVWVLFAAVGWILLFPVTMPLYKIFSYQRSLKTGSESSIRQRDLYERTFGGALLAITAVAILESLPWALEYLHEFTHEEHLDWTGMLAALAGALVLLSGSDRLLSVLSGAKKKIAMSLIGLLGLIVPLLVILFATDFLVYGVPPRPSLMFSPLIVPVLGVLGIMVAIPLGIFRRAFSPKESAWTVGLLVAGLIVVASVVTCGSWASYENFENTERSLKRIIEPVSQVAAEFDFISEGTAMDPEVRELVDQVISVQRKYGRTMADLNALANTPSVEKEIPQPPTAAEPGVKEVSPGWWKTISEKWIGFEKRARGQGEQFQSGQEFITLGNEFSALPRGSLEPLRNEIANLAHEKLILELEQLVESEDPTPSDRRTTRQQVRRKMREQLEMRFVDLAAQRVFPSFPIPAAASDDSSDGENPETFLEVLDLRLNPPTVENPSTRDYLTPKEYGAVGLDATEFAKERFQSRTVQDLSKLADVDRLLAFLRGRDLENWDKVSQLAELTGLTWIAELVSKQDIIANVVADLQDVSSSYQLQEVFLDYQQQADTADVPIQKQAAASAKSLKQALKKKQFERRVEREVIRLALREQKPQSEEGKPTDFNKAELAQQLAARVDQSHNETGEAAPEPREDDQRWLATKLNWLKKELESLKDATLTSEMVEEFGDGTPQKDLSPEMERKILAKMKIETLSSLKNQMESYFALQKHAQLWAYSKSRTIQTVAGEELARLILDDFDPGFLAMVAVRPDLYSTDYATVREKFTTLDDQLGEIDQREFERNQDLAELAKEASLETLVKHAFRNSEANEGGADALFERDRKKRTLPDVAKLLLAQRALKADDGIEKLEKHLNAERAAFSEKLPKLVSWLESTLGHHLDAPSLPSLDQVAAGFIDELKGTEEELLKEEPFDAYDQLAQLAVDLLIDKALNFDPLSKAETEVAGDAREALEKLLRNDANSPPFKKKLGTPEVAGIAVAKYADPASDTPDMLISTLMFGKYGPLERGALRSVKAELSKSVMRPKTIFIFLLAAVIWLGCWLTVDVNLTSIHSLYRDRLASAFLVGADTKGDVDIEEDIDLEEICRYEARSTAPYHLVNVALNLQGSTDIGIRDRNSDFFIFSKRFIGGERTGYCRSETMEQVFPQMSLATAMAISAAAASPNMGRGTSPLLVAFMSLLNIRLGFWMPNPGLLEELQDKERWKQRKQDLKLVKEKEPSREREEAAKRATEQLGFTFEEVFATELREIERRWRRLDPEGTGERQRDQESPGPTVNHGLVGIAFSGGGIRSATINLGITQALQRAGVFDHADYMSTVSGGGYLGSSVSTLMRSRTKLESEIAGTVSIEIEKLSSETGGIVTRAGRVARADDPADDQIVVVATKGKDGEEEKKTYRFPGDAKLAVKEGDQVREGTLLIKYRMSQADVEKEEEKKVEEEVEVEVKKEEGQKKKKSKQIERDKVVVITPNGPGDPRSYWFSRDAVLNVEDGQHVSAGEPLLKTRSADRISKIAGSVGVEQKREWPREQIVTVTGQNSEYKYRFSRFERIIVEQGKTVAPDQVLVERQNTLGKRFQWRVRPTAFLLEMSSRLDEKHRWVNLSDGGHIENLATIELLRRRCKFIIIGDGEADPGLHFNGLATLIRTASIDLGIDIDINLDAIRLRKAHNDDDEPPVSEEHWAIGKVTYPKIGDQEEETGFLLYLKSSFSGKENEVIQEYRRRNPSFPHQSTADQSFDEGQFEAYRALGQRIATEALDSNRKMSFKQFEKWFIKKWTDTLPKAPKTKQPGTTKSSKKA